MDKSKIQDIFMLLLILGFVGARLGYVLMNFSLYKGKILSILSLSHYNLSLLGGVASGLLALVIVSRIYKLDFYKLLHLYTVPFYFSIAIGIWVLKFDYLMLMSSSIGKRENDILMVSAIFLLAMILELYLKNKVKNKYITPIILAIVIVLYYAI